MVQASTWGDPWMETFSKFLSEFCVSPMIHVSWPNLAKIDSCEVAEKSSGIAYKNRHASGTLFSPHFAHTAYRAQKSMNVFDPWPVHVYRPWSGSAAVCRTYSGKSQKSQYNIGFQPTIIIPATTGWHSTWITSSAPGWTAPCGRPRCGRRSNSQREWTMTSRVGTRVSTAEPTMVGWTCISCCTFSTRKPSS